VRILGLESSCDDSAAAVLDGGRLLASVVSSQDAVHGPYGGVVPELASRDHIRRLVPLVRRVMEEAGTGFPDLDAIAYTEGPGLAGALLAGASFARGLACALGLPVLGIHHLEAHLLSPLMVEPAPGFPFVALLVSGGHSQLMRVSGVGEYRLLGETLDDAAGEAFDKTAKLLGLGYPGGPALARLAESGRTRRFRLPRPMISSGDLDMSFSGLKTAVLTEVRRGALDEAARADLAREFEEAVAEVLVAKAIAALEATGLDRLVVAGGVGANRRLRALLAERTAAIGARVYHPPLELCTDNGAMIAFAGAMRLERHGLAHAQAADSGFGVKPRWDLEDLGTAMG